MCNLSRFTQIFSSTSRLRGRLLMVLGLGLAMTQGACASSAHPGALLVNPFHDPFAQVTHGMADCPVASPPTYTHAEM